MADPGILGITGGVPGNTSIVINMDLFESLEQAEGRDIDYALFLLAVTILHEYVHSGYIDNQIMNDALEEGYDFEREAYGQVMSSDVYKQVVDDWLKEQENKEKEESDKKGKAANNLINNFGSLEAGTYEWNGTAFVKTD